jgi:AAA+ ATPase superfamily predicted ATPase
MFIGREPELAQLRSLKDSKKAGLAIVYGRRRVGKTTLIEEAFKKDRIIKIEGTEGLDHKSQIENFLSTLRSVFKLPILNNVKASNWKECFEILASLVQKGRWIVHLEELQWMANYSQDLIAQLKPVWDNNLRKNPDLILVLCGSSPSFFTSEVLRSKALYNRSSLEINLGEFSLKESHEFLPKRSLRSIFDAYLSVGGIPVYLDRLAKGHSVYLSLCQESFKRDSFFLHEYEKIFVSSFVQSECHRSVLKFLSKKRKATRNEIVKHLKLSSGGALTRVLQDLEACGFISRVVPLDKERDSLLSYYQILDSYLYFYNSFIYPNLSEILRGTFQKNPERLLDTKTFSQWLGYSFERYCRNHSAGIAEILGFSGVRYRSGTYFKRSTQTSFSTQVDLLFSRADKVLTVCEVKYTDTPVGLEAIDSVENKIKALDLPRSKDIQRVLISAAGATETLIERSYFDRIIGLEQLYQVS